MSSTARAISFTDSERSLMSVLARLRFATREQLLHWCRVSNLSSITRTSNALLQSGFLEIIDDLKPSVFRLSRAGCRVMSIHYVARRYSIPVIQHYCHRNNAEMLLRETYPTLTFQSRVFALRCGLFPAHAEHLVRVDDTHTALALIDDYGMHSQRILKSWTRPHTPDTRFYKGSVDSKIFRWSDVVKRLLVFSTDALAAKQHQSFLSDNDLPGASFYIKPIWAVLR